MPINNSMTLEQAWNLLESLNDDANQKSKSIWLSNDISKAIRFQSSYFKHSLLELDNDKQQMIQYWIEKDDEFKDYFKCLSENE
jgi:hypothetical protein